MRATASPTVPASLAVLASWLVVATGVAGCFARTDAVVADWERERDAHGPLGVAATFDLQGDPLTVTGEGRLTPGTGFDLALTPPTFSANPYLYFDGARTPGHDEGILVFAGARVHVATSAPPSVAFDTVTAGTEVAVPLPRTGDAVRVGEAAWPDDWKEARESAFFAEPTGAAVTDWTVTGFARGLLVTPGGTAAVTSPVHVDAARFAWGHGSTLRTGSLDLDLAKMALGGNVSAGDLKPDGLPTVVAPRGVFGHDVKLRIDAHHVRTTAPFRLTQAITAQGLLLGSKVEVKPAAGPLRLAAGQGEAWTAVRYREAGYRGDAVLRTIEVTGPGAAYVQVPVERPPSYIEELWRLLTNGTKDPWVQAFAAVFVVVASPALVLLEAGRAVACVFATCPDQYPFPAWMDAGAVGTFYVKAGRGGPQGAPAPGSYPVHVVLKGRNYDDVAFDLTLTVA